MHRVLRMISHSGIWRRRRDRLYVGHPIRRRGRCRRCLGHQTPLPIRTRGRGRQSLPHGISGPEGRSACQGQAAVDTDGTVDAPARQGCVLHVREWVDVVLHAVYETHQVGGLKHMCVIISPSATGCIIQAHALIIRCISSCFRQQ